MDDLCRVTVRTYRSGVATAVDIALPARMELGELMPSLVDLTGAHSAHPSNPWGLSRLGGSALDNSMTLDENGVRDGDLLVLSTESPAARPDFIDLDDYVVDQSAQPGWSQRLGLCAWVWSAGLGAATLGWPTHSGQISRAAAAAMLAATAAVAAVVASRGEMDPVISQSMGTTAAVFGALAGYLVVPGGPMPPNFFLAAAICTAVSILMRQISEGGSTVYTAIPAVALLVAVVAGAATIWPMSTTTIGAILAALALAMLSVAAKLSIILTGLSPRMPGARELLADEVVVHATVGVLRAQRGHQVLTGLLAGFSITAALGSVLVISDLAGDGACSRVALAGAVSATLIVRAGQQCGPVRSTAMFTAGLVSTTAVFTLAVVSAPIHAMWFSLIAIAMGAGGLYLSRTNRGSHLSPVTRRGLESMEYLVLATVVPMACWVGGLFGFVRGLSLP